MNAYIELVEWWLADRTSVSFEDLRNNAIAADAAAARANEEVSYTVDAYAAADAAAASKLAARAYDVCAAEENYSFTSEGAFDAASDAADEASAAYEDYTYADDAWNKAVDAIGAAYEAIEAAKAFEAAKAAKAKAAKAAENIANDAAAAIEAAVASATDATIVAATIHSAFTAESAYRDCASYALGANDGHGDAWKNSAACWLEKYKAR